MAHATYSSPSGEPLTDTRDVEIHHTIDGRPITIPSGLVYSILASRAGAEEKRAVLSHEQEIELNLAGLLRDVEDGRLGQSELKAAILATQYHVQGVKTYLSQTIEPRLYNESRSTTSTIAKKVFDIAELLELILDHLTIPDILKMSAVDRDIRNAIKGSKKMQTKLALRPASADSYMSTAFDEGCLNREGGFRSTITNSKYLRERRSGFLPASSDAENEFTVRAEFLPYPGEHLSKIGSTYRSIFICSPVIKEMKAHVVCCQTPNPWWTTVPSEDSVYTITSKTGITIGDLYDCAKMIMDEHRWCANAPSQALESDGVVKTGLSFEGSVVLQPDDPLVVNHKQAMTKWEAERRRFGARQVKLEAYRAAKLAGKRHVIERFDILNKTLTKSSQRVKPAAKFPRLQNSKQPTSAQTGSTYPLNISMCSHQDQATTPFTSPSRRSYTRSGRSHNGHYILEL